MPQNQEFHKLKMANARRAVEILIQNGTKASSPDLLSIRRAKAYAERIRLPDNSTGSKNRPFFYTPDQSHKPLGVIEGGVLKDYKYAKFILNRRAKDVERINLEKENIFPPEEPLLTLSDLESRSLELNNLLQVIQDAVELGDFPSTLNTELKNMLRIFISLLPTFTIDQISEYKDLFGNMFEDITGHNARSRGRVELYPNASSDDIDANGREPDEVRTIRETTNRRQFIDFFKNMNTLLLEYAPNVNKSKGEKDAIARELIRRIFKFSKKEAQDITFPEEESETTTSGYISSRQSTTTSSESGGLPPATSSRLAINTYNAPRDEEDAFDMGGMATNVGNPYFLADLQGLPQMGTASMSAVEEARLQQRRPGINYIPTPSRLTFPQQNADYVLRRFYKGWFSGTQSRSSPEWKIIEQVSQRLGSRQSTDSPPNRFIQTLREYVLHKKASKPSDEQLQAYVIDPLVEFMGMNAEREGHSSMYQDPLELSQPTM